MCVCVCVCVCVSVSVCVCTVIGVESSSVEGGTKVGVLVAPAGFVAAFVGFSS